MTDLFQSGHETAGLIFGYKTVTDSPTRPASATVSLRHPAMHCSVNSRPLEIAACPFADLPEAKSGRIRWVAKDDPVAHGQVSIPRPKRCAGASSLLRTPRLFELTKKSMNGSLPTISRRPDSLYSIKLVTAITRL